MKTKEREKCDTIKTWYNDTIKPDTKEREKCATVHLYKKEESIPLRVIIIIIPAQSSVSLVFTDVK